MSTGQTILLTRLIAVKRFLTHLLGNPTSVESVLSPQKTVNLSSWQVAGNFVTAPVLQQPRGVVHFLGGAFAGAAPQLAYQFLINWVADAGYTVVATPYAVTFRHLDCAARVHQVLYQRHYDFVYKSRGKCSLVPGNVSAPLIQVGCLGFLACSWREAGCLSNLSE